MMHLVLTSLLVASPPRVDYLTPLHEAKDYPALIAQTMKTPVNSESGRVAFYWGGLLVRSLSRLEPSVQPSPNTMTINYPDNVLDRGYNVFRSSHSGKADQLMRLWFELAVLKPCSPPGIGYGNQIASWTIVKPGSGIESTPVYGISPERWADIQQRIKKWHDSTDRFPELIVHRVFNAHSQPRVSDEDLTWLATSASPFRPVAVAELRVREGLAKQAGPFTARWNQWAAQNKGVLRDLLVRRVKRLLNPPPATKPTPPASTKR